MSGYGPEEMVPGIVTDQLTMIVNTRAGTNWPATEYAHVGYEVVSVELDVDVANEYSFNNIVQTPAYINVFKLTDGLSITLYETIDYTVDWINKVVHQARFSRRCRLRLPDLQIEAVIPTAEDVVIQKLRWQRDKDIADVRIVIAVQAARLDWSYIHYWTDQHGTTDLLRRLRIELQI